MRVAFSKEFNKAARKLSGKILQSLISALDEVRAANAIEELTDCKKIETLKNVYRLRIGDRRAFFILHIEIEGNLVKFEYLLSRGEAYDKKNMEKLRKKDI